MTFPLVDCDSDIAKTDTDHYSADFEFGQTYSESSMLARLKAVLPPWFGSGPTPNLDALLSGFATVANAVFLLIDYVRNQTRISTATDGFLDLIATDFFGRRIQRFAGELDTAFALRIKKEVLRARGTVASIVQMLTGLTGRTPIVFEPSNVNACGYNTACGYGVAGEYGSASYPGMIFVTAFRPKQTTGVPSINGYGGYNGGYGAGSIEYASPQQAAGIATDAAIYDAVHSCTPCGVIAWTAITN